MVLSGVEEIGPILGRRQALRTGGLVVVTPVGEPGRVTQGNEVHRAVGEVERHRVGVRVSSSKRDRAALSLCVG